MSNGGSIQQPENKTHNLQNWDRGSLVPVEPSLNGIQHLI